MKKPLHILPYTILSLLLALMLYSCASIGNPSGGPRDEDPPRVVRTSPAPYATAVKGNRIEIEFDELVEVKDAFTNVVVSPPTASTPKVLSTGRKVYVQWDDTLLSGTTYTVDFGNSIVDVNESNPLGYYSFTFSTGPQVDSLRISGMVLDAATLEPQQGTLVGVHPVDAPDTAFRTLRFERVTKTDDHGRFTIRGLRSTAYNLFALGDLNNDYRWDNPAELIAFYPQPVTPYTVQGTATDTIYNLHTGEIDSISTRSRIIYMPNNLLLSLFDTGFKTQYLVKYERPDSLRLSFFFNAPAEQLPHIALVDYVPSSSSWYVAEHSAKNDTVTYWLTDSRLMTADTLRVALGYERDDRDRNRIAGTDTLVLTRPKVKVSKPAKRSAKQMQQDSIEAAKQKLLPLKVISGSARHDVFAPLIIEAEEPLLALDTLGVHLEVLTDTIWEEMAMPPLMPDSTGAVRRYTLSMPQWRFGTKYRLTIDSLAAEGITRRFNASLKHEFTIKKPEDYAALTLRITPDTISGYVEVLNTSDKAVARQWLRAGIVHFPYLSPADYYVRFVAHNGPTMEFGTGDYDTRRQPDEVFYYPQMLSLKRYDRSETWDLYSTPVDAQKPDAIKKNKPKSLKTIRKKKTTGTDATTTEEDDFIGF